MIEQEGAATAASASPFTPPPPPPLTLLPSGAHALTTLRGRCLRGTTLPVCAAAVRAPASSAASAGKWEVVSKGETVRVDAHAHTVDMKAKMTMI